MEKQYTRTPPKRSIIKNGGGHLYRDGQLLRIIVHAYTLIYGRIRQQACTACTPYDQLCIVTFTDNNSTTYDQFA